MSAKLLLVCSDTSAFTPEVRYALKDRFKLYVSEEHRKSTEDDRRVRLVQATLVIIDAVLDKQDLKLLNVAEYKKVAVLRNHESRTSAWLCTDAFRFDAICKYKDHHLLTDFKDSDTLIKILKTTELDIEADCMFFLKKGLRYLLFCLNAAK